MIRSRQRRGGGWSTTNDSIMKLSDSDSTFEEVHTPSPPAPPPIHTTIAHAHDLIKEIDGKKKELEKVLLRLGKRAGDAGFQPATPEAKPPKAAAPRRRLHEPAPLEPPSPPSAPIGQLICVRYTDGWYNGTVTDVSRGNLRPRVRVRYHDDASEEWVSLNDAPDVRILKKSKRLAEKREQQPGAAGNPIDLT